MEYKIIRHHDLDGLEEAVNLAIKEGWKPIGSFVFYRYPYKVYAQTMIKN